tara:strand:+ start:7420 stop:7671 length:252 start_codon:yes stop_codon:yes gene_type:complete
MSDFERFKKKLLLKRDTVLNKDEIKEFFKNARSIQINVKTKNDKIIANFPLSLGVFFLIFAPALVGISASLAFILNFELELKK